ncbi:MAG: cytochrome ubiquinol oxidase subunit I [Archangium gephyra]|uniref:Cytochrome ubiquinol oxidase subunit I n=1 Tax=Archangium gephyra TaxID=48 RepID=A0A2W5VAF3_9BACT|nr:MAG: cytochrome ubiquinol oxidase subunit I [Archangium gephyra]
MGDPLFWHRLQFAFTIIYHYLFPQLTMGLALLIVIMKWRGLKTGDEQWHTAARFWIRVFGLNFAVGVVTGIPMEFQFGTNWARFSALTGGVIGQTLALEGLFAFFLESSFLAMLVFGEKKLGPKKHFAAAVALLVGSWLSGVFIIVTNAFMQHPTGYTRNAEGVFSITSVGEYLFNPWAFAQFAHNQMASLVTASFVVASVGAFWLLRGTYVEQARLNLKVGVIAGLVSSLLVAFPTGDAQAKLVAKHQPAALAAMEGRFESGPRAHIHLIGQPNVEQRKLDNPIGVPAVLSILAFGDIGANVTGLNDIPQSEWPTNIELTYYSFHVMVGLGTIFIGLMLLSAVFSWRGQLEKRRWLLWVLMLAAPFPYIANTAGWMAAELGRQPWLVYGLLRTSEGASPTVHSGSTAFTLIGFTGMYALLGFVFLVLVGRELLHGPQAEAHHA